MTAVYTVRERAPHVAKVRGVPHGERVDHNREQVILARLIT